MAIPRTAEATIRAQLATRPCVVLTGCRQTGKSHLAATLLGADRIVSLDLPRTAEEAETAGPSFLARHGTPLALDEVQYAPALLRSVKHAVDRRRDVPGQYFLTGNPSFQLMEGVTESLAGRAALAQLWPLSLAEIARFSGRPQEGDRLVETLFRGGYPEVHARDLSPPGFYGSYVATYLERDVRSLLAVRSLRDFDRFLRLLAIRAGRLLDVGALASETGVSVNTVKSWLSVLETSGVVSLVTPWFENLGRRLVKTPKVYFVDTGLLCALLSIDSPRALACSQLLGAIFENQVYVELAKWFAHQARLRPIHFYRDHAGLEVDFVIPEAERLHLIEVKFDPSAALPKNFDRLAAVVGEARIASRTLVTSAGEDTVRRGVRVCGVATEQWGF